MAPVASRSDQGKGNSDFNVEFLLALGVPEEIARRTRKAIIVLEPGHWPRVQLLTTSVGSGKLEEAASKIRSEWRVSGTMWMRTAPRLKPSPPEVSDD